jgi:hypothetical protein
VRLLTSAKSREKGTDETLREIEATGLGRLSSFPSVNLPSSFGLFPLVYLSQISQPCVRVPPSIELAPERSGANADSSEEDMCHLTLPGLALR